MLGVVARRVSPALLRVQPARVPIAMFTPVHVRQFGVMDRLRDTIGKQKDKKMNEKRRTWQAECGANCRVTATGYLSAPVCCW